VTKDVWRFSFLVDNDRLKVSDENVTDNFTGIYLKEIQITLI
jgi:hypothetical protein